MTPLPKEPKLKVPTLSAEVERRFNKRFNSRYKFEYCGDWWDNINGKDLVGFLAAELERAKKEATEAERERCVGIVEEDIERIQDNLKCVADVDVLRVGILIRQRFAAIVKKVYEKI